MPFVRIRSGGRTKRLTYHNTYQKLTAEQNKFDSIQAKNVHDKRLPAIGNKIERLKSQHFQASY